MADDLEERLMALEEATERRHAELLARLERSRPVSAGQAAQEARAAMRRGYEAADAEREAAKDGDGE